MNTSKWIMAAGAVMIFANVASAATSSGTLTVTATVESSISLTVESAGGSTSGLGTNAASSSLGNVSKYGAEPAGFDITQGASDWTLSSDIGVKVEKSNSASTAYTLRAQMTGAPANGVAWKLNGSAVTAAAPTTLMTDGGYGSPEEFSWDIVIADSSGASSVDNTITFTATSN